ncbi:hypothetical protein BH10PSE17_BH10PSE17_03340 [soil metagenome]
MAERFIRTKPDIGSAPRHPALRLALVLLPLLMTGCASLSKDACMKGNWEAIGQQDALDGKPLSQLNEHVKACGDYGVKPNATAYGRGYGVGLASFCTPQSGFKFARTYKPYEHQCPTALEGPFLAGMQLGAKIRSLDYDVNNLKSRIKNLDYKMAITNDRTELGDLRSQQSEAYDSLNRKRDELQSLQDRATQLGYSF